MRTPLRLATRGSRLALWQAFHVRDLLLAAAPATRVEIIEITTTGDRIQDVALSTVPGQGFFTKELELALLESRADLAVHSLKDVATALPSGLALAAVLERADPRDVVVCRAGLGPNLELDDLPRGARVGTSSLRRSAQLSHLRPDLEVAPLRGNVPSRLARLEREELDAILLAAAGLERLGLARHVSHYLDPSRFLPAPAQGAIAIEIRADDEITRTLATALDHRPSSIATTAERAFLRAVEGGCQAPVGALAELDGEQLVLDGLVLSLDGREVVRGRVRGPAGDPEALGIELAETLLARGAGAILAAIRAATTTRQEPA